MFALPFRRSLVIAALALMLPAAAVRAQQQPLIELKITNPIVATRTHAPAALNTTLIWNGQGILKGRLRLRFDDAISPLGAIVTNEIAMLPGPRHQQLLLPDLQTPGCVQLRVHSEFLRRDRTIPIATQTLGLTNPLTRTFVLGVIHPHTSAGSRDRIDKTVTAARLTQFAPEIDQNSLRSFTARLDPAAAPNDALRYTCFDTIFLTGEGLELLDKKQRQALTHWVRAGGSLAILADRPAAEKFLPFINSFFPADPTAQRFRIGSDGRITFQAHDDPADLLAVRPDLGRLLVITKPPDQIDYQSGAWANAIAFLWKATRSQTFEIQRKKRWEIGSTEASPVDQYPQRQRALPQYGDMEELSMEYHRLPMPGAEQLIQMLKPQQIRLVPLTLIVLILLAFTVVIGPVDYLLLGAIRRRSLTWITFPLAAVAFTAFTVMLSNHYLGRNHQATALQVIDVGADGAILHDNTFDMHFAARPVRMTSSHTRTLFAPIHREMLDQYDYYYRSWNQPATAPPTIRGRYPFTYRVDQPLEQWNPQINRLMRIQPADETCPFDFDALNPDMFTDQPGCSKAARLIYAGSPYTPTVIFLNGQQFHIVPGDDPVRPRLKNEVAPNYQHYEPQSGGRRHDEASIYQRYYRFIEQISAREPDGLFHVLSQISPTGAGNFEDLTILDTTDPNQWLVLAVTEIDGRLCVYRRLYHGGS